MQYDKNFQVRVHLIIDYLNNWWLFSSVIRSLLQSVKLGTDESGKDEGWKSVHSTQAKIGTISLKPRFSEQHRHNTGTQLRTDWWIQNDEDMISILRAGWRKENRILLGRTIRKGMKI